MGQFVVFAVSDDTDPRGTVSVLELILRIINHSIDFFFKCSFKDILLRSVVAPINQVVNFLFITTVEG